jgi:hypothetical protein
MRLNHMLTSGITNDEMEESRNEKESWYVAY